jgi:LacI family transcriptional regulator
VNSWDIARAAGVSQSTVSRVVNGHSGVRAATRARVLAAIARLGYVPNAGARALITGRTRLIGLVVSNITNAFYPEVIQEIGRAALERGYNVILCNTEESAELQSEYVQLLIQHRVAGVIMTSSLPESRDVIETISGGGFPIVQINRVIDDLPLDSVTIDNVAGGRAATRHLLELGHTGIAYVGGLPNSTTNRDRLRGHREAMSEAGRSELVVTRDFTRETSRRLMAEVLGTPGAVTAAVCADDTVAFGCLDAIADAGLSVPEDVALIGFDDVPMASLRAVSLTTVPQPAAAMGRAAVELLIERITGPYHGPPRRIVFPAQLIHRRSCGCGLDGVLVE